MKRFSCHELPLNKGKHSQTCRDSKPVVRDCALVCSICVFLNKTWLYITSLWTERWSQGQGEDLSESTNEWSALNIEYSTTYSNPPHVTCACNQSAPLQQPTIELLSILCWCLDASCSAIFAFLNLITLILKVSLLTFADYRCMEHVEGVNFIWFLRCRALLKGIEWACRLTELGWNCWQCQSTPLLEALC